MKTKILLGLVFVAVLSIGSYMALIPHTRGDFGPSFGSASAETVTSFNVPGCTAGEIWELVAAPLAEFISDDDIGRWFKTDCSLEPDSAPTTDFDALLKGHSAVTDVPLEL